MLKYDLPMILKIRFNVQKISDFFFSTAQMRACEIEEE